MSIYQLEPPDPSADRRTAIRIIVTLTVIVLIVGALSALLFLAGGELVFGPTPTPTATAGPPRTPTRDFGATRVAENFLTQQAFPVQERDSATVEGTRVAMVTPTTVMGSTPIATDVTAPTSESNLPLVVRPETDQTPLPTETATPTPTPLPTETATATPTPTATATLPIIDTSTPTPASLPTATAFPSPTPTLYIRNNIPARVRGDGADAREGPSTRYEVRGRFGIDRDVSLQGRTVSGEWLQACCIEDNNVYWLRAAEVELLTITPTPESLPTEIADQYTSTRWLAIKQPDTNLEPLPVATPISPETFPLFRYDNTGRGMLPRIPIPPLVEGWIPYNSGNPFSSAAVASASTVAAANDDPRLYGINRNSGSQRFRTDLTARVQLAPALHDGDYYLIDQDGRLYRIQIQESQAVLNWDVNPGVRPNPTTALGINLGYEFLYYTGTNEQQQRELVMVRRSNGEIMAPFLTGGDELSYPVIGDQLVYVGGSQVWALDINNVSTMVWNFEGLGQAVSAPPAYVFPGRRALAELYVGERSGELRILDANSGVQLENWNTGGEITGIAVDEERLYVTTTNQLLVYRLQDLALTWDEPLESRPLGGPLVDGRRVFIALQSGIVRIFQADSGFMLASQTTAVLGGAPALVNQDIYLPGSDGFVYHWRGTGLE